MSFPSRWVIAEHWAHDPHLVTDLGEPSCFCCGFYKESWDKAESPRARWNGSDLERAHLVAVSADGTDEPSNFVLLCSECHERAPMTIFPEIMLRWVRNGQPHPLIRRIQEALAMLRPEETPATATTAQLVATANALGVGTHGTRITAGTIAAVLKVVKAAAPV